jgi:hypothetical protein
MRIFDIEVTRAVQVPAIVSGSIELCPMVLSNKISLVNGGLRIIS